MDYLFVFKNDCWWLKITTPEELFHYWSLTDSKWGQAFDSLIHSKEFTKDGMQHANPLAFAAGLYASNRKLPLLDAIPEFSAEIKGDQLEFLLSYGVLYINQKGGYHFGKRDEKDYSQFYRSKKFIFPDFKENEIKVKTFTGGQHFYAYIGDMEVRDGDIIKWDTYEEAYQVALRVVSEENRNKSDVEDIMER